MELSEIEGKWKAREQKLFDEIDGAVSWYTERVRFNWYTHRTLSTVIMLAGVIAPLLVININGQDVYTSTNDMSWQSILALSVTILLAFLEGLKRIFRFEQRWVSCFWARTEVKRARERYRIAQIDNMIGSDSWKANLLALRSSFEGILDKESKDLFNPNANPGGSGSIGSANHDSNGSRQ